LTSNRLDVVFVFLDDGDKNLYQVRQWIQPLQRLAKQRNVTVLYVSDEVTPVLADTGLGAAQVELPEGLVEFLNSARPRLLLYPNQNARNFYALRYGEGVHAWVSHGESEKAYMFQNTLKRYDFYFAAGPAAAERVAKHIGGYNLDRIKQIGRPQVADRHSIPEIFKRDPQSKGTVFYAPTWEGVTGATRYSSIVSHGAYLVQALIELGYQVIYRPHPLSGSRDEEIARADLQIRSIIEKANRTGEVRSEANQTGGDEAAQERKRQASNHLVDDSTFGWQLDALDVMITDVSAVAYDWLSTAKPLIITRPVEQRAVVIDSPLFEKATALAVAQIGELEPVLAGASGSLSPELSAYYFAADSNPDALFEQAVESALADSESLAPVDQIEVFMPRGAKLGWLRYPNFALRVLAKALGFWTTVSKRNLECKTDTLYAHFSDPFDTDAVKAWIPRLRELLTQGPVVLATNQITTKLLLRRELSDFGDALRIIPCVSTLDSETLIELAQPKEIRYLKDHPTNLAALRANGIRHTLFEPETDPHFKLTHTVVMYDAVQTKDTKIIEGIQKIHKKSQPNIR
jgi:hypothetical protein